MAIAMSDGVFLKMVEKIARVIIENNRNPDHNPVVPPADIGFLMNKLPKYIPDEGEDIEKIIDDTVDNVLPYIGHVNAHKFASLLPSPNCYPSVLGDMLCVAMGGVGFCWESCPPLTELELLMADWYGKMLHLPPAFLSNSGTESRGGGFHQQTENDALYNCYLAARYNLLESMNLLQSEHKYEILNKLVIYASVDCHLSVLTLCKTENLILRQIKCDQEGNIDGGSLQRTLLKDIEAGLKPLMGIANLGGFIRFGIDSVYWFRLCRVHTQPFWIHVDATFGGCALMLRDKFLNLDRNHEFADSIAVTLSNYSPIAFDSTLLWVRRFKKFKKVFVINPAYLKNTPKGAVDLRNYGIALSRRFRAFKHLFTARLLGSNGILNYVCERVEIAKVVAQALERCHPIQVALHKYTIVHFCLEGATNERNRSFYAKITEDNRDMLLFPITIDGKYYIRFTPNSCNMILRDAIEIVRQVIFVAETMTQHHDEL